MLIDFQNFVTLGLSRDRVMNWLLKVPSLLKASIHYLIAHQTDATSNHSHPALFVVDSLTQIL